MSKPEESKQEGSSRRKVLKAAGATGAAATAALLPPAWTKPVVEIIVVPAHAQTTVPGSGPKPVSDRRLKRDIRALATLETGIRLYTFRYLWSDTAHVGVMAQDLLARPAQRHAARKTEAGFYVVDYACLGLRMATLAEWQERGLAAVRLQPAEPAPEIDAPALCH